MGSDEFERGSFHSLVLLKLEILEQMGRELKDCMKVHNQRITKLEHTETRVKAWGAALGVTAGFIGSKLTALLALLK